MAEYVYCAVNKDGKIQIPDCSENNRTYYKTPQRISEYVYYHNCHKKDDPWRVAKFELVEVRNG